MQGDIGEGEYRGGGEGKNQGWVEPLSVTC